MFKLDFNTGNTYEGAWHESDWNFHLGYFTTREKAEEYIESIFEVFKPIDAEYNRLCNEISAVHDKYPTGHERQAMPLGKREAIYDNEIKPLRRERDRFDIREELKHRRFYIITEITEKMLDKSFDGDIINYVNRHC